MRKVHIQFTSPKGKLFPLFSWAIRTFECTPYSHVRIFWLSKRGKPRVYEASGSHVKLIGSHALNRVPVSVLHSYEFNLDDEQFKKMIELLDYSHVDYGIWQIFGIAIARIFKLKRNPLSSGKNAMVCSELVAIFLNYVLDMDIPKEEFDLIGPRGVKELLDRHCAV